MKRPEASDQHTGPLKDVFRHKLEGLKAAPSDHLWERLELNLDREQVARDRSRARLLMRMAAVLLLLLLSVGGFLSYQYLNSPAGEMAIKVEKTPADAPSATTSDKKQKTVERAPLQAPGNTYAVSSSGNPTTDDAIAQQRSGKKANGQKKTAAPDLNQKGSLPALNGALARVRKNKPASESGFTSSGTSAIAMAKASATAKTPAKADQSKNTLKSEGKPASTRSESSSTLTTPPKTEPIAQHNPKTEGKEISGEGKYQPEVAKMALSGDTVPAETALAKDSTPKRDSSAVAQLPVPDSASVQKDSLKAPASFGWSVSALAGPVNFRQNIQLGTSGSPVKPGMVTIQSISHYGEATREFNENTRPETSYQAGLLLGRNLNSFLKLEAGIGYGKYRAGSELSFLVTDSVKIMPIVPEPQTYSLLLPTMLTEENVYENKAFVRTAKYKVNYEYRYLSFPVQLQVFRDFQKWRNFISVGMQANKLLESHITTDQPDVQSLFLTEDSNTFFRSFQWSVLGSAGVGYLISPHILIQGCGSINRSLVPITKAEHIQGTRQKSPQTLGLNLSVAYLFGK